MDNQLHHQPFQTGCPFNSHVHRRDVYGRFECQKTGHQQAYGHPRGIIHHRLHSHPWTQHCLWQTYLRKSFYESCRNETTGADRFHHFHHHDCHYASFDAYFSFAAVRKRMSLAAWKSLQRWAYVFFALIYAHVMVLFLPKFSEKYLDIIAYTFIFGAYAVLRVTKAVKTSKNTLPQREYAGKA